MDHGALGHRLRYYEEVLRVPLLIRLPGDSPPKGRVKRVVAMTDIFATALHILDIDRDAPPDSMSLMPLMGDSRSAGEYKRKVAFAHVRSYDKPYRQQTGRTVEWTVDVARTKREKFIRTDMPWVTEKLRHHREPSEDDRREYTEELYDMREDPGETRNLAPQDPARAALYRDLIGGFLKQMSSVGSHLPRAPKEPEGLTDKELEIMKALGYL
jgi:arylsulfatase A-like enzyme